MGGGEWNQKRPAARTESTLAPDTHTHKHKGILASSSYYSPQRNSNLETHPSIFPWIFDVHRVEEVHLVILKRFVSEGLCRELHGRLFTKQKTKRGQKGGGICNALQRFYAYMFKGNINVTDKNLFVLRNRESRGKRLIASFMDYTINNEHYSNIVLVSAPELHVARRSACTSSLFFAPSCREERLRGGDIDRTPCKRAQDNEHIVIFGTLPWWIYTVYIYISPPTLLFIGAQDSY